LNTKKANDIRNIINKLNKKEVANMKLGKILIIVGMIAVGILGHGFTALATEPPRPGTNPYPPEYWAVFVVDCNGVPAAGISVLTTVRAKKVVDCEVETKAFLPPPLVGGGCGGELTAEAVRGQVFRDFVLFDGVGDPGVYKVRNFKKEVDADGVATGIYSFDGLIRYWRAAP
jgi:hypothetical protein